MAVQANSRVPGRQMWQKANSQVPGRHKDEGDVIKMVSSPAGRQAGG